MTTFFLLPPRSLVAERLADALAGLLPGLGGTADAGVELAEALASLAERHGNGCVLFRDELPDAGPTADILRDGFGAEAGDRVVEVRTGSLAKVWVLASTNGGTGGTITAEDRTAPIPT